MAVDANGGMVRMLDPNAGSNLQVGIVTAGLVVYRCDAPHWPSLRVVRLDGTGLVTLCESLPKLPFFSTLTNGRVVYYQALAGQAEGGRLFSVALDGSDTRPVGASVSGTVAGQLGPSDQDFEVMTPSGRFVLESEFEPLSGSHLVIASTANDSASVLPGATAVRFAALIP
jgi:hypothetical protein